MRKIFLIIRFAAFTLISDGQSWRRLISDPYEDSTAYAWGSGLVIVKDTVFALAVFNYNYNDSVQFNLIKIDPFDGDPLQYFSYKDTFFVNTTNATLTNWLNGAGSDNLYSEGDAIWLNSASFNWGGENSLNRLFKISDSFGLLRIDTLSGLNDLLGLNYYGANRPLAEGGRVIYGFTVVNSQGLTAGLISKLSSDFTQQWVKSIPDCKGIAHVAETPDHGFLLGFMNYNASVDAKSIVHLDSLGNIVRRDNYAGYSHATDFGITVSSLGEMIVAFDATSDELNSIPRYLIIRKIQDAPQQGFETIFERQHFLFGGDLQISSIQEMSNGDYMIWGQVASIAGANLTFNSQGYVTNSDQPLLRGFLFRVSADFDSLWCRTYFQPDTAQYPFRRNRFIIKDIDFDSQGNIYTVGEGSYIINQNSVQKLWVMKVDEYGCLEPGCQFVDVDEVVVGYEQSMTVYPNPTQGLATIQFSIGNPAALSGNFSETKLIVTDMQGRRVMEKKMPSMGSNYQTTIDLSGEPAGLYYVQWVSGSSWLDQVSVVKE
jgi:hypothetical protein